MPLSGMSRLQKFHEIPVPHSSVAGHNHTDAAGENSIAKQAPLYRPRNANMEPSVATVARFASRLIDRTTGKAKSFDEIQAELDHLQTLLDGLPDTAPNDGAFEALLNPTGANNSVLVESTNIEYEDVELLIDATTERYALSVNDESPLISIVSGDKHNMRVTADFGDGEVTYDLHYDGIENGKPSWDGTAYLRWTVDDEWVLEVGANTFTSTEDVASPDLATTWVAGGDAEDEPALAPFPATADQVIQAIGDAALTGITATDGEGSNGTGFVAGVTSLPFVRTVDATLGLPRFRTDGDKLYVNVGTAETPTWKTLTFDT